MERRQLEHFLAVAESESLTRAAARLGVAQPSLSQSIRKLEFELRTPLFERRGRGVRLTTAGEALVAPARRTVRSFALAAGAVKGATEEGYGRISVLSNTLWTMDPLVPLIGRFRQVRPAVQFAVVDPERQSEVLRGVQTGAVDFGLVADASPADSLSTQWLVDHEFVALLPEGVLVQEADVTIGQLLEVGLVCTPQGTALREYVHGAIVEAGSVEVAVETEHVAALVPLVLAGAGAAVLPERLAFQVRSPEVRVARIFEAPRASVSLVWRTDMLDEAAVHFLQFARHVRTDVVPGLDQP